MGTAKEQFEEVHEALGENARYPLSEFYEYTKRHHCEENVDFYREASQYSEKPNTQTKNKIIETYIEPGASKEVNLESSQRYDTLEKAKRSELRGDLFVPAQKEVLSLLRDGPYNKFMVKVQNENLNSKLAKQARYIGYKALLVAFLIEALVFGLQIPCDPSIVTDFCQNSFSTNRLWRLLGAPALAVGLAMVVIGKMKVCPLCASRGATYMDESKKQSYLSILLSKTAKDVLVRVDTIYKANKRRGQLVCVAEIFIILVAIVALLLVPPNQPEWY